MMPDLYMSTKFEVSASYPMLASLEVATFSTTCVGLIPVFFTICVIGTLSAFLIKSTPIK